MRSFFMVKITQKIEVKNGLFLGGKISTKNQEKLAQKFWKN